MMYRHCWAWYWAWEFDTWVFEAGFIGRKYAEDEDGCGQDESGAAGQFGVDWGRELF